VVRVAGEITSRVIAGAWPPGTCLPAQRILADEHSTNQGCISQAMTELARRGVLVRTSDGYFAPDPSRPAPAHTIIAAVLEWSDGTRTRMAAKNG
jgi:DNA-binding transcriptional MocR family regulator